MLIFELCENIAIVERYHYLENYTQVVLNMFRFIEHYLYHTLDEQLGYTLIATSSHPGPLLREGKKRFPNLARYYGRERIRGGTMIMVCENIKITGGLITGVLCAVFGR
ncbi:MAG: hypothetical protein R3B93_21080 [Bacteroidia bacterium]